MTPELLQQLIRGHPAATDARDQLGNQPLHYLCKNPKLSQDVLQAYLRACGEDGARILAETPNKWGRLPLRELIVSPVFSDNHLRIMLRASDATLRMQDQYGRMPLQYLSRRSDVTPFQQQVADEVAMRAGDESGAECVEPFLLSSRPRELSLRALSDEEALRLFYAVQKYSLWFHGFQYRELKLMHRGVGSHRMRISRFMRGELLARRGSEATFIAIVLAGEIGVRHGAERSLTNAMPRRLQKGSLFGERAFFMAEQRRPADLVAISDGVVATLLFSELELLAEAHPKMMGRVMLQIARAAVEEELAASGLYLEDLEAPELQRRLDLLLASQRRAHWKARHGQVLEMCEGFYQQLEHDGLLQDALDARVSKSLVQEEQQPPKSIDRTSRQRPQSSGSRHFHNSSRGEVPLPRAASRPPLTEGEAMRYIAGA